MFEEVNQSKTFRIILVLISDILLTIFIVFVVFTKNWLDPIEILTLGLINVTLIVNLGLIGINGSIIFFRNEIKPKDVGLIKSKILTAIIIIAIIWGLIQLFNLIIMLIQIQTIQVNPSWEIDGIIPYLGDFVSQIFGNALYEEMIFRGFLISQFYILFRKKVKSPKITLLLSLFVSQGLFALKHIPIRLLGGVMGVDLILNLLLLLGLGFVFAIIYLRTNNLFITIGIHSLYNVSLSLFNVEGIFGLLIFTIILLVIWPKIENKISFWNKEINLM
jgi:uncharacterized protein